MRECTICLIDKPTSEFNKQSSARDGLKRRCKTCQSSDNKRRYELNGERIRATVRTYAAENPVKVALAKRARYLANRDVVLAQQQEYTRANWGRIYMRNRAYIAARPDQEKMYATRYRQANMHKGREKAMRRKARKLQATPQWSNPIKIRSFYESADALCMLTGEWYHVDHIVPLQGKTVCGLHNEFNLQILTAFDNASKGNRYWPNQP